MEFAGLMGHLMTDKAWDGLITDLKFQHQYCYAGHTDQTNINRELLQKQA